MKKRAFLLVALFAFLCNYTPGIYNPRHPDYIKPGYTYDNAAVENGDTIGDSSVTLRLRGNSDVNRFNWRLDNGAWSGWEGQEKGYYDLVIDSLDTGAHTLQISVCYSIDSDTTDSVVVFYRGNKPIIEHQTRSPVEIEINTACTLIVAATGTPVVRYQWFRDGDSSGLSDSNVLIIDSAGRSDAGKYICVVKNAAGKAVSDTMIVRMFERYRVTYDGNGNIAGKVPVDTSRYRQGNTVKVPGNSGNLVNNGKTFVGWMIDTAGGGMRYSPDGTFIMDTFPVTLYAAWTDSATYRVLYNNNGATSGSVPEDRNNYLPGMTVTVAGPGDLAREGFGFAEWNTADDGAGTPYTTDTTFIMKHAAVTLYAQWTDSSLFPVTYVGNGNSAGKPPVDNKTYKSGDTVTVKGNTGNMEKQGLAFLGWSTRPQNRDTVYVPGTALLMGDTALTLYAQWTGDPTWTVTYDGNGNTAGRVPAAPQKYVEGAMVTVFGNTGNIARTGHAFKGWNASKDGNGTPYAPGATFRMGTFDVTMYAVWETNQYMVVYDGNGKTEGNVPPSTNHRFGTQPTVANIGDMRRTGYTFFRWNTKKDGTGFDYEAGVDKITIGDANDTLYARWTANRYPVVYYGNGNTGGNPPAIVVGIFDSTVTLADKGGLAKECYSFAGWDTMAGGGEGFLPGAEFTISRADTNRLYAQWKVNQYPVIYYGNGNTDGSDLVIVSYDYGSPVAIQPPGTLAKSCSSFVAWNMVANGSGTAFREDTVIKMPPDTLKLFAQWAIIPYTITFDKNDAGATGTMGPQTVACGARVNLTPNAYVKTGWTFAGWAISSEGAVVYSDKVSYTTRTGNTTLYARWTVVTYTITYHLDGGTNGNNPTSYTIISPTVTLLDASKISYVSDGWYSNSGLTVKVTSIPTGSTGNRDLWAKWVIKDADGNIYTEVKIGDQVWMVENLKTTKYNDGSEIPLVTDTATWAALSTPGYCWYENDDTHKNPFGALYNWYTVNTGKLAPKGWHVPDTTEWNTLENYLIANGYNWDGTTTGNKIAKSMAATTNWYTYSPEGTIGNDLSKNNKNGFSAFPGGFRDYDGPFHNVGGHGYWWSATENGASSAWYRYLDYNTPGLYGIYGTEMLGFSVRCVRD